jgi:hypothetical protein
VLIVVHLAARAHVIAEQESHLPRLASPRRRNPMPFLRPPWVVGPGAEAGRLFLAASPETLSRVAVPGS